uniref:Alternative protein EGF n=1 Tax=Homo sapiens TaxID=9606 RepID=L8EC91_HUMAN|nr:alternative protein EGF [Homo sapiens]
MNVRWVSQCAPLPPPSASTPKVVMSAGAQKATKEMGFTVLILMSANWGSTAVERMPAAQIQREAIPACVLDACLNQD